MKYASDIPLPDQRVVVVGDVHGNFRWLDIIARGDMGAVAEHATR